MSTIFVSDLDGTLLNSNANISKKSVKILNKLMFKVVLFTYATARSWESSKKILSKLYHSYGEGWIIRRSKKILK